MKIGILTLHDSPNYGAVLQACALRAHLLRLGHKVAVIDRRRDPTGRALKIPPQLGDTARVWGLSVPAFNGAIEYKRRCVRTLEFLRRRVGLTAYGFHSWRDAPHELGFDVIVVGSDQVWNANNLDPDDYLLKDVPGAFHGIAYAASMGMRKIPVERLASYREGLTRFSALSMREKEAVELVRSLGFSAAHVVDPVLLAGGDIWHEMIDRRGQSVGRVFSYFLAEDFESLMDPLARFGAANGRRVDFFADWFVRRPSKGLFRWLKARRFWRKWTARGIDFRLDAGPEEFVRAIAAADVVISNSYHALMFALIFGKPARIVLPSHPVRREMNARFQEFEGSIIKGRFVFETLHEALSYPIGATPCTIDAPALAARIDSSSRWLRTALHEISETCRNHGVSE